MESERALLLIADIGGYTEYMRTHRMSLAHAEVNTARLLEAVIDAAGDFELIEIEGDAAFLSRQADALDDDATVAATTEAVVGMHRAFHRERQYVAANLCPCDGCEQAENLKLKFVAHVGEVATQTISDRRKLVGHRRHPRPPAAEELRRGARVRPLLRGALPDRRRRLPDRVQEIPQDLEGIGPVRAYFVGHRGRRGLTPRAAGSPLARAPRADRRRRRPRPAVHAGPAAPAPRRRR